MKKKPIHDNREGYGEPFGRPGQGAAAWRLASRDDIPTEPERRDREKRQFPDAPLPEEARQQYRKRLWSK